MTRTSFAIPVLLGLLVGCGDSVKPCTAQDRFAAFVTVEGADVDAVEARLEEQPWVACSPSGERYECGSQMVGTVTLRATAADGRQSESTIESVGDRCGPDVNAPEVALTFE